MAAQYKLHYFHTRGQAEAIRFLLSYCEVPFEDHRIDIQEWHQLKPGIPFGKLPVLEVDGRMLFQPLAICRYLGQQFNLVGQNTWEAAGIDAVADTIKDLNEEMLNVYLASSCKDKEIRREKLVKESFPAYFSKLDGLVGENGGHLVGRQLSWADLYFASGSEAYSIIGMKDVLSEYLNLTKLNASVRSMPSIQSWLSNRPFSAF